jgi:hypothetical protein
MKSYVTTTNAYAYQSEQWAGRPVTIPHGTAVRGDESSLRADPHGHSQIQVSYEGALYWTCMRNLSPADETDDIFTRLASIERAVAELQVSVNTILRALGVVSFRKLEMEGVSS